MNERNDIHDDDLRQLMPTVDRIEPAPPEMVERLWVELQPLLDDGEVGKVATLVPREVLGDRRRRWTTLVSAAAVVVVLVAGLAVLTRSGEPTMPPEPAAADLPSATTDPPAVPAPTASTVPLPATVEAACEAFRRNVAATAPFDSLDASSLDEVEPLTTWVDGLGILLADLDRVGRPSDSADQYLSIQLLRTALRAAIDDVEAGNDADAATALANARRHIDAIQLGESSLTGCLPPPAG